MWSKFPHLLLLKSGFRAILFLFPSIRLWLKRYDSCKSLAKFYRCSASFSLFLLLPSTCSKFNSSNSGTQPQISRSIEPALIESCLRLAGQSGQSRLQSHAKDFRQEGAAPGNSPGCQAMAGVASRAGVLRVRTWAIPLHAPVHVLARRRFWRDRLVEAEVPLRQDSAANQAGRSSERGMNPKVAVLRCKVPKTRLVTYLLTCLFVPPDLASLGPNHHEKELNAIERFSAGALRSKKCVLVNGIIPRPSLSWCNLTLPLGGNSCLLGSASYQIEVPQKSLVVYLSFRLSPAQLLRCGRGFSPLWIWTIFNGCLFFKTSCLWWYLLWHLHRFPYK